MLNECLTPMGKRKFTHNFLNPVIDEEYLQCEYDIIEKLLTEEGIDEYKVVKVVLVQIKDISQIMRKIIIQKATPKLLYQLYASICSAKIMYNFVIGNEDLAKYLKTKLPDFVSLIEKSDRVMKYLNDMLILDDCKDIDNINKIEKSFIQNGVDSDLDNKIKILMDSQDQLESCRSYFSSLISNYETDTKSKKASSKKKKTTISIESYQEEEEDTKEYVSIHETDKNNFSLLATERRCKILDEMIKNRKSVNLKYCSSYSGIESNFSLSLELEYNKQSQTKKSITNAHIQLLCKNVGSIKVILIDTVSKVYQTIVKKLQEYHDEVESICNFITHVDLVYSKAYIAAKYNYCKPEIVNNISGNSFIRTTDLRHCLIEKIQQNELYVANQSMSSLYSGASAGDDIQQIFTRGFSFYFSLSMLSCCCEFLEI
jgi:DNA mismatch repair protein MutS